MSLKASSKRDPFAFSLGGMTTIASFVTAPAIADDRIRQSRKERPAAAPSGRSARTEPDAGYSRAA